MTDKEISMLRLCINMTGLPIIEENVELIYRVYQEFKEKKGKFTIDDATDIQQSIIEKYHGATAKEEKK